MAAPKTLKSTVHLPNGTCSVIMEIDFQKKIFKITDTITTEFTEPTDIQNLYATASAYCVQQIQAAEK